jgi:hypothetical protein
MALVQALIATLPKSEAGKYARNSHETESAYLARVLPLLQAATTAANRIIVTEGMHARPFDHRPSMRANSVLFCLSLQMRMMPRCLTSTRAS